MTPKPVAPTEYVIGVCPTCGGVSHLDKQCLTHPEHTAARRIVRVCNVEERDYYREALERIQTMLDVEHQRALNDHEPTGYVQWIADLQSVPRCALRRGVS